METVTIVIIIGVACVLFKVASWFLICRNASDERKRYRARQLVRLGRGSRRSSGMLFVDRPNINSREKQTPLLAPVIMATTPLAPTPVAIPTAVESNPEPEVAQEVSTSRPASTATEPTAVAPAAGAAVVTMAAADVALHSPEEDTKVDSAQSPASQNLDPDPDPDPEPDDDLEVVVPPAAMVSMTIGGAKTAKKLRRKESPTTTEALPMKVVTPAPDFDDYKSRSPKSLSPGYSPPALPTPQYLDPPPPSPPTNRQITLQRQRMARRLQEQEGMDF